MSQKDRILQLLQEKGRVSNYELHDLRPSIYQYPTRIWELKHEGHQIETEHDKEDPKKWWYVYAPVKPSVLSRPKVLSPEPPELFPKQQNQWGI
jgi:hypothetical protein